MASILDENQQKSLIELMLSDPSIFSRVKPILKSEYFDKKFQHTIDYLIDFSNTYNSLPLIEQLNVESRVEYKLSQGVQGNIGVQNSILDGLEQFIKRRALEIAIEQSYALIAKGETIGIDKIIKDAQLIGIKKDFGINFWEHPEEWLNKIEEELKKNKIKSLWKTEQVLPRFLKIQ